MFEYLLVVYVLVLVFSLEGGEVSARSRVRRMACWHSSHWPGRERSLADSAKGRARRLTNCICVTLSHYRQLRHNVCDDTHSEKNKIDSYNH